MRRKKVFPLHGSKWLCSESSGAAPAWPVAWPKPASTSPEVPVILRPDFAGQGLGGGGGLVMATPLLPCFVLPLLPGLPPFLFLRAHEHRKNNFLCNSGAGNPIPDKL